MTVTSLFRSERGDWLFCRNNSSYSRSCSSTRTAKSTDSRFTAAELLSMREMDNISRTRFSICPVTFRERSRYLSRSR